MKILALIPDPRAAYALADVLAGLPRTSVKAIAYGHATAAALPAGLELSVYPVREGTRLPAPFLDALVAHERPTVVLAPAGSMTAVPVPVLLVDLDPFLPVVRAIPAQGEENGKAGWIEAVTADANRRRELLRAGLFSVDLKPEIFEPSGRLSGNAAAFILARLIDMASLAGPALPVRTPPPAAIDPPAIPQPRAAAPPLPEPEPAPRTIPVDIAWIGASAPAQDQDPLGIESPPPAGTRFTVIERLPPAPEPEQGPESYRDRHAGGRVLVLAGLSGVDALTPADLSQGTVIAVPATVAWLSSRMGVAHYVCCAAAPSDPDAATATATVRAVVVHGESVDGETLAPRARSRVAVRDLHEVGGPELGWSDDLEAGFFPGPGDLGLALQWASWLGPAEIAVAGVDARQSLPLWPAFWRGARELLEERGTHVEIGHCPAPESAAKRPDMPWETSR